MAEWHVTPEYIVNNWTDEKFDLLVSKLAERKQQGTSTAENKGLSDIASIKALELKSRGFIKVVKKDGG